MKANAEMKYNHSLSDMYFQFAMPGIMVQIALQHYLQYYLCCTINFMPWSPFGIGNVVQGKPRKNVVILGRRDPPWSTRHESGPEIGCEVFMLLYINFLYMHQN